MKLPFLQTKKPNLIDPDIHIVPDEETQSEIVSKCRCCGTLVRFPVSASRYKCSVCQSKIIVERTTHSLTQNNLNSLNESSESLSLNQLRHLIRHCQKSHEPNHIIYKPIENLLTKGFSSSNALNNSFKSNDSSMRKSSNINYLELWAFYKTLTSLPTKRPYYRMLLSVNELLRRPTHSFIGNLDLRLLFIFWEIPTLSLSLYHERKPNNSFPSHLSHLETPEIKSLSYEIIKRIIGYLANSNSTDLERISYWISSLKVSMFAHKVQLINLYITFHLTRLIHRLKLNPETNGSSSPNLLEYINSPKLNGGSSSTASPITTPNRSAKTGTISGISSAISISWGEWARSNSTTFANTKVPDQIKLKPTTYNNEWHLRSASRLMSIFFVSNKDKIPIYSFYNTLVDFVQLKHDFELWQNSFKASPKLDTKQIIYDLLYPQTSKFQHFTFCNYPFLLSLGAKISILEYEAKRTMERKAEEAFLKSLDYKKPMDVNLKIQVRRSHIANDSIRCIKNHQLDLQKALKVEFIGEPGIDVGGLKKEWFGLLTKQLLSQETGMFQYNDESNLCWFAPMPLERNDELYYMIGVVLGLAIYNSTILDLKFPLVLYKKLLNKKTTLNDYAELFPSTGNGLIKLLEMESESEISDLNIYFETTFKNFFDETIERELIPNGSKILVTKSNKKQYVEKWCDFYLNKIIEPQFKSFHRGFHNVIGGNALSLFAPKEIEMMICGNNETTIDIDSLKSITKYNGYDSLPRADVLQNNGVKWFWEWFADLNPSNQRKFLSFVTGSDRIPATGISTMSFKITRLFNDNQSKIRKLPVAHTCFNELCLYDYVSKDEFVQKINLSINESEGFGLK